MLNLPFFHTSSRACSRLHSGKFIQTASAPSALNFCIKYILPLFGKKQRFSSNVFPSFLKKDFQGKFTRCLKISSLYIFLPPLAKELVGLACSQYKRVSISFETCQLQETTAAKKDQLSPNLIEEMAQGPATFMGNEEGWEK